MQQQIFDATIKINGHIIFHKIETFQNIVCALKNKALENHQAITLHISKHSENSHNNIESQYYKTNINVLEQQILLFDNDNQIIDYIQTQKILAENIESVLSQLCFKAIKICKKYCKVDWDYKIIETEGYRKCVYTKQKLDSMEQDCLETFRNIKEERKKIDNCIICWTKPKNTILIPCMHLAVCQECKPNQLCPLCKCSIQNLSKVYL